LNHPALLENFPTDNIAGGLNKKLKFKERDVFTNKIGRDIFMILNPMILT